MSQKNLPFNFKATGIGSVPYLDVDATCLEILDLFPSMPFWPQFVKRSYVEGMNIQYTENLPLLKIDKQEKSVVLSTEKDLGSELVTFYDHLFEQDLDYFAISREYAPGLYRLLEMIDQGDSGNIDYIKGQTVGPITFAAAIIDQEGKPILHNPELFEAMTRGLAIKALWQVRELGRSGKRTVIFLDEPYLSGFGSAFSSIQRHEVVEALQMFIGYLKENSDTLVGIHCCGNTDWSMIIEASPDIINFDAYGYMEYFLLYPDDVLRFLKGGGIMAWGVVPTSERIEGESSEGLSSRLESGLSQMVEWGISPDLLARQSILTPACGMGSMEPEGADTVVKLLSLLSRRWAARS
ncbi:MAG: hypothetical protein V2J25_17140 [Desulfatiglans sp.]|jgi:hypothetical protein|nr:hypothetical protein [Thermodesulfobacteriota bacterium]MEE4354587.1 hypothetical protein [Desulfatiglans sp.]